MAIYLYHYNPPTVFHGLAGLMVVMCGMIFGHEEREEIKKRDLLTLFALIFDKKFSSDLSIVTFIHR